jgi:hypothetical protein
MALIGLNPRPIENKLSKGVVLFIKWNDPNNLAFRILDHPRHREPADPVTQTVFGLKAREKRMGKMGRS